MNVSGNQRPNDNRQIEVNFENSVQCPTRSKPVSTDISDENSETFQYKACKKVLKNIMNLNKHIDRVHGGIESQADAEEIPSLYEKSYKCNKCEKVLKSENNLLNHLERIHKETRTTMEIKCTNAILFFKLIPLMSIGSLTDYYLNMKY